MVTKTRGCWVKDDGSIDNHDKDSWLLTCSMYLDMANKVITALNSNMILTEEDTLWTFIISPFSNAESYPPLFSNLDCLQRAPAADSVLRCSSREKGTILVFQISF